MTFARVIDFETTDLDPAAADVIEVGWVDVRSDGQMTRPRSMLCRPAHPISVEAMAAHHLSEQQVERGVRKQDWQDALTDGKPVAYVAHHAAFEASFWPDAPAPWICTYKAALRLWPEAPRHTNQVLRYFLLLDAMAGFDPTLAMPPHRAGPDAYVTAWIFSTMLALEGGEHRLKRLLAWTREPGLLPRVLFGKHRLARWSEVPVDYLQWIMRQTDMDEDVRFTATQELQRRPSDQGHLSLLERAEQAYQPRSPA